MSECVRKRERGWGVYLGGGGLLCVRETGNSRKTIDLGELK